MPRNGLGALYEQLRTLIHRDAEFVLAASRGYGADDDDAGNAHAAGEQQIVFGERDRGQGRNGLRERTWKVMQKSQAELGLIGSRDFPMRLKTPSCPLAMVAMKASAMVPRPPWSA